MLYTSYVGCETFTFTPSYVRSVVEGLLDPDADADARADVVNTINLLPLRDRRVLALLARGFGPTDIAKKVYGTRQHDRAAQHTEQSILRVTRILNGEMIPGINGPGKRRGRPCE